MYHRSTYPAFFGFWVDDDGALSCMGRISSKVPWICKGKPVSSLSTLKLHIVRPRCKHIPETYHVLFQERSRVNQTSLVALAAVGAALEVPRQNTENPKQEHFNL